MRIQGREGEPGNLVGFSRFGVFLFSPRNSKYVCLAYSQPNETRAFRKKWPFTPVLATSRVKQ